MRTRKVVMNLLLSSFLMVQGPGLWMAEGGFVWDVMSRNFFQPIHSGPTTLAKGGRISRIEEFALRIQRQLEVAKAFDCSS